MPGLMVRGTCPHCDNTGVTDAYLAPGDAITPSGYVEIHCGCPIGRALAAGEAAALAEYEARQLAAAEARMERFLALDAEDVHW